MDSLKKMNQKERRNLILYAIGKMTSIFGNKIYIFAVGLYVLTTTGSSLSFATTLICSIIPMLLINPIAGVIADKIKHKRVIIMMDLINGIVLLIFYSLTLIYPVSIGMIYISVLLLTLFTSVFQIAMDAGIPLLVQKENIITINAISKSIDSIAQLLGPIIGGMIFALVDFKLFILINGITFLLSACTECFLIFEEKQEVFECINQSIYKNFVDGLTYVKEHTLIIKIILIFVVLNIANSIAITVPLPLILMNRLHMESKDFGMVEGMFAVGMLMGAVLVRKVINKCDYKKMIEVILGAIALIMIGIAIPILPEMRIFSRMTLLFYYGSLMFLFGINIAWIEISNHTLVQHIVPKHYIGRVLSIILIVVNVCVPICFIIVGIVMQHVEPFILPIVGAVFLAMGSIVIGYLLKAAKYVGIDLTY